MMIKQDNVSNNDIVKLKDWINVREGDHLWKAWCPESGRAGFSLCLGTLLLSLGFLIFKSGVVIHNRLFFFF